MPHPSELSLGPNHRTTFDSLDTKQSYTQEELQSVKWELANRKETIAKLQVATASKQKHARAQHAVSRQ